MSKIELRILQYFLTIAREETISKAAKALHITQPTLSRQMKDLEDELGKTLFIRGNRKIILTEDGMFLRKRAEEIINLVEKTEAELLTVTTTLSGDIYIGGGETEGMRLIAKVIKRMQDEHSLIKCHLYSGNAEEIMDRLDKGLLDFGLLIEPDSFSAYDYIHLPSFDVWGVLIPKTSPLAILPYVSGQDLIGYPLICSSQDMAATQLQNWLARQQVEGQIAATYNLIYNAALLVEEGVGYAITLEHLIPNNHPTLCFKPFHPTLTAKHLIVWKKYQIFSKAAEYFLEILQEEIDLISD